MKFIDDSSLQEHRDGLALLANKRYQWLVREIAEMEKPFAWEITSMDFPDARSIIVFLKSPMEVLKIRGFGNASQAQDRVAKLRSKIKAPLEFTVIGQGRDICVEMWKVNAAFGVQAKKLTEFKEELCRPDKIMKASDANARGNKRPREEAPTAFHKRKTSVF